MSESQSQPELPRVPTRDRLPAVVIEETTKKTLGDVRWLLGLAIGSIVTVFGGGFYAFAQVREVAKDEATQVTQAQTTRIDAVEHALQKLSAEVTDNTEVTKENTKETRELRKDLRLVFPTLPPMARLRDAGADAGP